MTRALAPGPSRARRALRHWVVVVVAMDLAAVATIGGRPPASEPTPRDPASLVGIAAVGPAAPPRGAPGVAGVGGDRSARIPTRIEAGSIDLAAPVAAIGLESDGTLQVPAGRQEAGWWSGGGVPGALDPTVIVGHVNLRSGPAVFVRLDDLAPGDVVTVIGADGVRTDFEVTAVEQVDKRDFPTERVYARTERPELRLVTCGGSFRPDDRTYTDNVIVYAKAVPDDSSAASRRV